MVPNNSARRQLNIALSLENVENVEKKKRPYGANNKFAYNYAATTDNCSATERKQPSVSLSGDALTATQSACQPHVIGVPEGTQLAIPTVSRAIAELILGTTRNTDG